jgi:hypothetical protein
MLAEATTERKKERIERDMPSTGPQAFTIAEFCAANKISQGLYFKLQRAGKGPRTMPLGASVRISIEAAADWRRDRENEAAAA